MTRPQLFHRNATERQLRRQVKSVNIVNDLQINHIIILFNSFNVYLLDLFYHNTT